ncbi:D-2-hydroxyacid dehydrogenase [Niallia sp. 01092]|uniref:D-2-hydroxyacid dehydrogenase n=1 Tax=unclassified Niallia TaxID=2837522 RepID=UPI003FD56048
MIHTDQKKLVIYIRNNIPEKFIDQLKQLGATVMFEPWTYGEDEPIVQHNLSECTIILTLGLHDHLNIIEQAPNIQWIQSISVGLDSVLNERTLNSDIIITNTKGCTSVPIAEHTIAMISSFARGIPAMIQNQQNKIWQNTSITDLEGATVGIIGYGEIGKEIAKRCKAFDMTVIGCRKRPTRTIEEDPADQVVGLEEMDMVIKESDFLILALPSTPETFHIINKEKLQLMKPTSFLINVGRGNTVAEQDLLEILQTKKLAGAALDVFDVEPLPKDHPFWKLDNVIISPHNAYFSPKSMERYMNIFLENVYRFQNGQELINVVDKKLGY